MARTPDAFLALQLIQLKYVSQFSNAVLHGGLEYECRDAFNYEKNTATMPYQFGIPTERELNRWCQKQAEHPSFQLSNAVLFPAPVNQL